MAGINLAETCHIVNALAPVDSAGAAKATDFFNLKNYSHVSAILQIGVTANETTLTVEQSNDAAGTTTAAITFAYYKVSAANGDTMGARTIAPTTGVVLSATDDAKMVSIEIDASQLSDGYPWLVIKSSAAAACLESCAVILSGNRYSPGPTAIA